jgi:hypothetical protein
LQSILKFKSLDKILCVLCGEVFPPLRPSRPLR